MKNALGALATLMLLLIIAVAAAAEVPAFSGSPTKDLGAPSFLIDLGDSDVVYLPLDGLGRAQGVSALVRSVSGESRSTMGAIRPTGWQQTTYGFIAGLNLYNKSHLLAHQLGGAEISENVVTGTQYLNHYGMSPVESAVAEYIRRTGNSVRYEVIPYYDGDNFVCSGVVIQAQSVEDDGISVAVYAFNVQPGVAIDYATGYSVLAEHEASLGTPPPELGDQPADERGPVQKDYVLNTNTHRFHRPNCPSVDEMKAKNRRNFHGTREELIDMGYKPCSRCEP